MSHGIYLVAIHFCNLHSSHSPKKTEFHSPNEKSKPWPMCKTTMPSCSIEHGSVGMASFRLLAAGGQEEKSCQGSTAILLGLSVGVEDSTEKRTEAGKPNQIIYYPNGNYIAVSG